MHDARLKVSDGVNLLGRLMLVEMSTKQNNIFCTQTLFNCKIVIKKAIWIKSFTQPAPGVKFEYRERQPLN